MIDRFFSTQHYELQDEHGFATLLQGVAAHIIELCGRLAYFCGLPSLSLAILCG